MTGALTPVLGGAAALVAVAVVVGVVDILRRPAWAWKSAGEPRLLCLALVVLLPVVGLAIYVFGARPKVVAVTTTGRAATLPFERFTDRADTVADNDAAIGVLARPTVRGSFGEPVSRPLRATAVPAEPTVAQAPAAPAVTGPGAAPADHPGPKAPAPTAPPVTTAGPVPTGGFFDDPDVLPVGAAATFFERGAMTSPTPTGAADDDGPDLDALPAVHIPGAGARPYSPRQRQSLDEGQLARPGAPADGAARVPAGPAGASGGPPVMAAAGAPAASATALSTLAPRVGTSTPEIFRPRPETVAPIAGTGPTGAPAATLAARWMNDPTGRHQYRYWDGANWTENVYDAGVESRDPVTD